MNIKLYNAAMTQLRGKAMESLALIDVLLNNPTMVPDHSSLVDEIMVHSQTLAEYEGAMLTLQQYFAPERPEQKAAPRRPMPPGATPETVKPNGAPIREDELVQRSTTFRNSQKNVKKEKNPAEKA